MSSYGDDFSAKDIVCTDIRVKGEIDWTGADFKPPLSGSGGEIPTWGATLQAGSDANRIPLLNVSQINFGSGLAILNDDSIRGVKNITMDPLDGTLTTLQLNAASMKLGGDIECEPGNFTEFKGSVSSLSNSKTEFTNCDFRSATNQFPTSIDDDTLSDVLGRGNSAGSTNVDMNGQDILNVEKVDFKETDATEIRGDATNKTPCFNLDLSSATNTFPGAGPSTDTLADVMGRGNSAGTTDLDMNNQSVINANAVQCVGMAASGISTLAVANITNALTITGTGAVTDAYLNIDASTGRTATLEFTGTGGQTEFTTFIEGDDVELTPGSGVPTRTKCTNLDLTDSSNLFGNAEDSTNWGGVWDQVGTNSAFVMVDEDDITGWRFFQPMNEDGNVLPGTEPFYVITAPTTNPNHANQVVDITFTVTEYGYGRIYVGLFSSSDNGSTRGLMDNAFRLMYPIVALGGMNVARNRMTGTVTQRIYVGGFPTDGTTLRIYPVLRCEDHGDEEGNQGRLEIQIGGLPEDADAAGTLDPRHGQVIIKGQPVPTAWRTFITNSASPSSA